MSSEYGGRGGGSGVAHAQRIHARALLPEASDVAPAHLGAIAAPASEGAGARGRGGAGAGSRLVIPLGAEGREALTKLLV